jgi:hypothetical protein
MIPFIAVGSLSSPHREQGAIGKYHKVKSRLAGSTRCQRKPLVPLQS